MIIYKGQKAEGQCGHCPVGVYDDSCNGRLISYLKHRIVEHSPDGFQWGYGGSGPADLALNMLVDYFMRKGSTLFEARQKAMPIYMKFKTEFIAKSDHILVITRQDIDTWLRKNEK